MKKAITFILAAALAGAILSSCGKNDYNTNSAVEVSSITTSEEPQSTAAASPESASSPEAVKAEVSQSPSNNTSAQTSEKIELSAVSMIDSQMYKAGIYKTDITDDGKEDTINLYTSAEVIDGIPELDDRNKWLLEIDSDNGSAGYYTLYDSYISHGDVTFSVLESENQPTVIVAHITDAMGTSEYAFIAEGNDIIKKTYSADDYTDYSVVYEVKYE